MIYSPPLLRGLLVKRYKRFLADVRLSETGQIVTAHCPNPGAMIGVTETQTPVWLRHCPSPKRKLSYSWELAEENEILVGVNTLVANELLHEALLENRILSLTGFSRLIREPKVSPHSRLDFKLIYEDKPPCYVEVKSVQMRWGNVAAFPDSPTKRGQKHLDELMLLKTSGARVVLIFVVQRNDHLSFTLNGTIDPDYKKRFVHAQSLGLEAYAYSCHISPFSIALKDALPLVI